VTQVWKYDDIMKTIWMRYIEPPHIILRKGLCQAIQYPSLAEHVGEFMAATLFNTSRLHLTDEQFRAAAAKHINPAMCAITEQVITTKSGWPPWRHSKQSGLGLRLGQQAEH
jgi:5-methylthioribose kinase